MEETYCHLSAKANEALKLDPEKRISYIRKDRFIPYPVANEILADLEDLLSRPKINRMPGRLIIARSNNGKSSLIRYFVNKHPPFDNPDGESIRVPVLLLNAPNKPDVLTFYESILDKLRIAFNPNHTVRQKHRQVFDVLKNIDLGMIAIDETNNLVAGSAVNQRNFLNMLKELSNEIQVPVICLGTREAHYAIRTDDQILNRYPLTIIPTWNWDETFRRLLASLETVIPLKQPSNLQDQRLSEIIYGMAGDTIGDINNLIQQAAVYAIKTGAEQIDEGVIRNCGYRSPAIRADDIHKI